MKHISRFTLIVYCLALFSAVRLFGQTYEEKFNLNFKEVDGALHGWSWDINNSKININTDTTDIGEPTLFSQMKVWDFRQRMDMNLYSNNLMILPTLFNQTLTVKISYKSKNLEKGRLFVYSLSKEMNIVKIDSICLRNTDSFREDEVEINTNNLCYLHLQLQAIGEDSTYTPESRYINSVKGTIPHEICILRIELKDGDRTINELTFEDIPSSNFKVKKLSSDFSLSEKQLKQMSERITALGEVVHGSGKIEQAAFEYIKSAILNNNTTLILWEYPLLRSLFFNLYASGSDFVQADDFKVIDSTAAGVKCLELAEWLREYNKTTSRKVSFLGNDVHYEDHELFTQLKDYLQLINKEAHSQVMDSVISSIQYAELSKIKEMANNLLTIVEENQSHLSDILGKDLDIIRFYIHNLLEAKISMKNSYYERDYRMFNNTTFLTNLFCKQKEKVVIRCHLAHANYQFRPPMDKSFGSYMKEFYRDDYICIAQTVCEDSVGAKYRGKYENRILPTPSHNSIESAFEKYDVSYGYVEAKDLDKIIKIRTQGAHHVPESATESYIHPQKQMQGVLIVR